MTPNRIPTPIQTALLLQPSKKPMESLMVGGSHISEQKVQEEFVSFGYPSIVPSAGTG